MTPASTASMTIEEQESFPWREAVVLALSGGTVVPLLCNPLALNIRLSNRLRHAFPGHTHSDTQYILQFLLNLQCRGIQLMVGLVAAQWERHIGHAGTLGRTVKGNSEVAYYEVRPRPGFGTKEIQYGGRCLKPAPTGPYERPETPATRL